MSMLICLTVCMLLAPKTAAPTANGTEVPTQRAAVVTFSVGSSATSQQQEGVSVLLVAKDGHLIALGQTDITGRLSVVKDRLLQQGGPAILFCKERFFCGALRLDDQEFFDYDFHLIHLAPFTVS